MVIATKGNFAECLFLKRQVFTSTSWWHKPVFFPLLLKDYYGAVRFSDNELE